ncbi:hypothetical protein BC832DRAFT_585343 [Gaertneriomyces semiglobifer]|nr:hypothetical protein BC832DRAFT_585343 [Gaertneriomyces semiglobifer]
MPSKAVFIITGASRGFGRSIAVALAKSAVLTQQPSCLVLVSRDRHELTVTKDLVTAAHRSTGSTHSLAVITQISDFGSHNLDFVSEEILRQVPDAVSSYTQAYLFNNAGSLGKLDRIRTQTASDIRAAIDLNVTAPTVLTAAFLRRFASVVEKTVIVNVSSLAGIQPFDCWGIYSAGKAARDMIHKVIALEESLLEEDETQNRNNETQNPRVRVLNYAPGPLDTDMQTRIRQEMPDVALRDVYTDMHVQGKLVDPNTSAVALMRLLEKDEYENGDHVDFYDVELGDQPSGKEGLVDK